MAIHVLFLTFVVLAGVSGQFLDSEFILDSVPLPIRRKFEGERYEIQSSIGREIESRDTGTAKSAHQGRRHIDNRHHENAETGQMNKQNNFNAKPYQDINQNVNEKYETREVLSDGRILNNGEQSISYDNQYSARIQQQNQENYVGETNVQHSSRHVEKQNQRSVNIDNMPFSYDSNLKINPMSSNVSPSENNSHNHRSYQSNDNARTNSNSANLQSDTTDKYSRGSQQPTRTNANNENIIVSQNQDSYNQQYNPSNVRTNQQTDRIYENSRTNANNKNMNNENTYTEVTQRSIDSNSYKNRQNVDSPKINNNRNNDEVLNRQNTEISIKNLNRNYQNNRQSTESSQRMTPEDRLVTDSTKSTQDNELSSRKHSEGKSGSKSDDKWVWNGDGIEMSTKSSVSTTTLPGVDDRAAFAGDKCPTGQVRFNNMCVNTD